MGGRCRCLFCAIRSELSYSSSWIDNLAGIEGAASLRRITTKVANICTPLGHNTMSSANARNLTTEQDRKKHRPFLAAPYLVADSREKFVHPFLRDAGIACIQRQIQVGDYLICRATDTEPDILAVFERKTWKDFAASITDGRVANLDKMLELRAATGCKLFYILEGPAFPLPSKRFQRVPFARIQALVTELIVFHGVFVVQTLDQRHTAARLREFTETFGCADLVERNVSNRTPSLPSSAPVFSADPAKPPSSSSIKDEAARTDALYGPDALPVPKERTPVPPARLPAVPALATKTYEKSAANAAIDAWARLRGVSLVLGKLLSDKYSFADFVRGGVTGKELDQIKTANGKALNRSARTSLDNLSCAMKGEALRVLAGIQGIGPATAEALLAACDGSFARLLSYDIGALGIISCGTGAKESKKLGETKASRLHAALHYSGRHATRATGDRIPGGGLKDPTTPLCGPPGPVTAGFRPPGPIEGGHKLSETKPGPKAAFVRRPTKPSISDPFPTARTPEKTENAPNIGAAEDNCGADFLSELLGP